MQHTVHTLKVKKEKRIVHVCNFEQNKTKKTICQFTSKKSTTTKFVCILNAQHDTKLTNKNKKDKHFDISGPTSKKTAFY